MDKERDPYDLTPDGRSQLDAELYDLLLRQVEEFLDGDKATEVVDSLMQTFENAIRNAQARQRDDQGELGIAEVKAPEPVEQVEAAAVEQPEPIEQPDVPTAEQFGDVEQVELPATEQSEQDIEPDMDAEDPSVRLDTADNLLADEPTRRETEAPEIDIEDSAIDLVQAIQEGREIPERPQPEPVDLPDQVPQELRTPTVPVGQGEEEPLPPLPELQFEEVIIDDPPTSPTPDEPATMRKIDEFEEGMTRFIEHLGKSMDRMSQRLYDLERRSPHWDE